MINEKKGLYKKKKLARTKDNISFIASAYVLLFPGLFQYVKYVANFFLNNFNIFFSEMFWTILFLALTLFIVIVSTKHMSFMTLLFPFCVILLAFISRFVYGEQQVSSTRLIGLLVISLPCFLFGQRVEYNKIEISKFKLVASIALIINITYSVVQVLNGKIFYSFDMGTAYSVLPCVLVLIYCALIKGGIKNWIFSSLGILYLLFLGSRGPIICIVAFFILFIIKRYGFSKKTILTSIGMLMLAIFSQTESTIKFINSLADSFEKVGVSARFLRMLAAGNIAYDNGRSVVNNAVISAIKERPLTGYGIFGDRIITRGLSDRTIYFEVGEGGTYSHNLILEFLCNFGVIAGTLLSITLIYLIIKKIKATPIEDSMILFVAICVGCVKLLVSLSYLTDPTFFFLLGLIMSRKQIQTRGIRKFP